MTNPLDLPISIVSEIIKNNLTEDVCLSKNTKIAFSRLGGVFTLYISHLANEICKGKGKSKISVKDVIEAMEKSGFNNYKPEIEELLHNIEKDSLSNTPHKKRKTAQSDAMKNKDVDIENEEPKAEKELKEDNITNE